MKPRKPNRHPPAPGGVTYHDVDAGPPIYHVPIPGTPTPVKFDRATGTFVVDADPKRETQPALPDPVTPASE